MASRGPFQPRPSCVHCNSFHCETHPQSYQHITASCRNSSSSMMQGSRFLDLADWSNNNIWFLKLQKHVLTCLGFFFILKMCSFILDLQLNQQINFVFQGTVSLYFPVILPPAQHTHKAGTVSTSLHSFKTASQQLAAGLVLLVLPRVPRSVTVGAPLVCFPELFFSAWKFCLSSGDFLKIFSSGCHSQVPAASQEWEGRGCWHGRAPWVQPPVSAAL